MKKRVLIVDDDLNVCREIKEALQNDNTTDVFYALSAVEALELFMKQRFCLVIMDVLLSETDGWELLKTMRQAQPIPILVLSAKTSSSERAALLRAGANVYLEKPCDLEECLAQAKSLIQLYVRSNPAESRCYTLAFGLDLIINPLYRNATLRGEPLDLTRKEFDLLYCLARHEGQVLSREQLYSLVWNDESPINVEATVKSHLSAIRKKLDAGGREYIRTVWGVGYRFDSGKDFKTNKT